MDPFPNIYIIFISLCFFVFLFLSSVGKYVTTPLLTLLHVDLNSELQRIFCAHIVKDSL